jgi:FG-GAP repeat
MAVLTSRLSVLQLERRDTPSAVFASTTPDGAARLQNAIRADVTGDGVAELIVPPTPGGRPAVDVLDAKTYEILATFDAYEPTYTGAVNLAAGDLNGDGKAEIITGADLGGGPRVRVLDGASVLAGRPRAVIDFMAIEDANFRGGVRIAAGDLNSDGLADLVVGAGKTGGPRVAGYDGAALARGEQVKLFNDFFSSDPGLRDGTQVAIGDVTGDGRNDLRFAPAEGSKEFGRYIDRSNIDNMISTYAQRTPERTEVYDFLPANGDAAHPWPGIDYSVPKLRDASGVGYNEIIPSLLNPLPIKGAPGV